MNAMKRVVIIVLAILIPLIIGTLAYIVIKLNVFSNKSASNQNTQAAKEITCSVGDFTVNLDDPGYKRYMKVTIYAGYNDKKLDTEFTEKTPQIRNAIIEILRSKKVEDVSSTKTTDIMRNEIKEKLNSILQTGKVNNIYFSDILIQ